MTTCSPNLLTKTNTQPGAVQASLEPYLFAWFREDIGAGSARGREAPEIQDTAGTARGVTERSYDGTVNSISTPRVPRKGSLNDRNLAAFRLP